MSEDKDSETHFKSVEVVADIKKEEPEELEATPKVSEEKLRRAQLLDEINAEVSIKKELPKTKKATAQIPEKGELGKKFTVKLDKRYETVELKVYQGEKIKEDRGNTNIIHEKTDKDTDEVSYDFFDPTPLRGKIFNGLTKGKYLVKVYAHGHEERDQLEQEQVVDVQ